MFRNLYSFLESGSKVEEKGERKKGKGFVKKRVYIFFLSYLLSPISLLLAQKPQGKFLSDSIEVGKPIDFALSFRHKPTAEVFFPDTSYNYYPFELVKRNLLPTNTDARGSLDSVIYTLVSFDIEKVQKLSLPIYNLAASDCTAVFSPIDSVFLKEMIRGNLDSLSLKTDVKLLHLPQQANYPKILSYILGILSVCGLIYLIFGKFIRKQYQLFLFGRKHNDFVSTYKKIIKGTLDDKNIGKAVVLWKKHLEWLEKRPYSSYTTKEIVVRLPNESLEEALKDVDSAIYGGILSTQMPFAMNVLLNTAVELYKKRREELNNI